MEFKHKAEYSIDNWRDYQDDEDISLAYGKVTFLSTRPNSHRHLYTEEVIKEYAPSYLGKFIVSEFDEYTQDASSHTNNQKIIGYIPTTQEVQYSYAEDGYLEASVDVVLSKIYASDIYNLFRTDNYRSVSVEQLVGFTPETEEYEDDGDKDKIIVGFEGIGITILGKAFNPSIPRANVQLTQMSEYNIKDVEMAYVKYAEKENEKIYKKLGLDKEEKMSKILEKLESIENKLKIYKEDKMADIENKEELEQVEDKTEMAEPEKKEEEQPKEEEQMACGGSDEEKMADEEAEKKDEEEVKDEDKTESKMAELESKITVYEEELAELRKFKEDTQSAQKMSVVSATMSQVKEFLDNETFDKYSTSGKECKYEDINGWKNEVLASVADKALAKMSELSSKEEGITDMGLPMETKDVKESIYD